MRWTRSIAKGFIAAVRNSKTSTPFCRRRTTAPRRLRSRMRATYSALFICGLAGRPLKLEVGSEAYTDTETIHLPARIFAGRRRANRIFCFTKRSQRISGRKRVMAPSTSIRSSRLAAFADPVRALALYHYLETTRIDANHRARSCPDLRANSRPCATTPSRHRNARVCATPPPRPPTASHWSEHSTQNSSRRRLSYMGTLHPDIAQAVRASRARSAKRRNCNPSSPVCSAEQRATPRRLAAIPAHRAIRLLAKQGDKSAIE